MKILVDFTAIIHHRHPMEMTGAYWAMNLVLNQAGCFVAVKIYVDHNFGQQDKLNEDVLWKLCLGLSIFALLNFKLFLMKINQKYVPTFFSTMTGPQFVCANFRKASTDYMKFDIFTHHPMYYEKVSSEAMNFLVDNWDKWEEEKPSFFTAAAIKNIPPEMLPVDVLHKLGGVKNRRESIDKLIKEEEIEKRLSLRLRARERGREEGLLNVPG